jgi:hypothetical protein
MEFTMKLYAFGLLALISISALITRAERPPSPPGQADGVFLPGNWGHHTASEVETDCN